jgi:hypothetical protein
VNDHDHRVRDQRLELHTDAPARPERPRIRTYWLPRSVLDRAWQILRQDGLKGVESTVLLGGRRFGDEAAVMAVLYPCGSDVALEEGFVHVGSDTTAEMGRWLRRQGLAGLIQVHTHPGRWTGHSKTDDDFPIASSEGFVSLVWPYFAASPVRNVEDLGVHRLVDGEWQDVVGDEARTLIRIVESEAMIWAPRAAPRPTREWSQDNRRVDRPALLRSEP